MQRIKHSYEDFLDKLRNRNIPLSHQRIKVLEYLFQNRCHPTADEIFCALHEEFPTLSKTTIYNTLNLFTKVNIVRVINIEENENRYDLVTENHGHFKCEVCGAIYDFAVDMDAFSASDMEGFVIHDKNVYFKGICPGCALNIEDQNK